VEVDCLGVEADVGEENFDKVEPLFGLLHVGHCSHPGPVTERKQCSQKLHEKKKISTFAERPTNNKIKLRKIGKVIYTKTKMSARIFLSTEGFERESWISQRKISRPSREFSIFREN
jgi:hypothetical protein